MSVELNDTEAKIIGYLNHIILEAIDNGYQYGNGNRDRLRGIEEAIDIIENRYYMDNVRSSE